jgi:CBS domain containing-hemolysin-like protein
VAERSDRPGALATYLNEPLLLIVPLRLLRGLVTAAVTVLFAIAIGVHTLHNASIVLVSVAAFVLVFDLLLPVTWVVRDPERVVNLLLPSFSPIAAAFTPAARWAVLKVAAAKRDTAVPVDDEKAPEAAEVARAYLESGEQGGIIEGEERRLLQSIVDFGNTLVREVMVPRPDIVAIHEDATIRDLRTLFREQEYSRFPVYKENLDNIAGFVFIKDLVLHASRDDGNPIKSLVRPAAVVPETKRVPELLKQFQRQQTQCAIVVDEYGGTAGLVTIEDLLEEIVGEIRDEYDVETEPVVDEGQGRFVFSGKVDVDEVAQRLNVQIERVGFETVGGYLMSHLGRVPAVGERLDVDGLSVEVLDAERRRVNKVRIWRRSPVAEKAS